MLKKAFVLGALVFFVFVFLSSCSKMEKRYLYIVEKNYLDEEVAYYVATHYSPFLTDLGDFQFKTMTGHEVSLPFNRIKVYDMVSKEISLPPYIAVRDPSSDKVFILSKIIAARSFSEK